MRKNLLWLAVCTGCAASIVIFFAASSVTIVRTEVLWMSRQVQAAAVFFIPSISVAQIHADYYGAQAAGNLASETTKKKVRILIVPGHQPDTGGTVFDGVYERDVVVDIADALAALLAQNPHYEVMVARTKSVWNPVLQSYFDTHALEIDTFVQSQKLQMANYIADGRFVLEDDQVYHNDAPPKAVLQLYGINRWTSDNQYDITMHLHLNDYAGHRAKVVGKYDGFTIYVPDRQYSNAEVSRAVGEAIAARLNAYHATSTLPKEDKGVVPDRELIATGSNNTMDGAALLVEYGYIYEPQFQNQSIRTVAVADYAYQTYLGLQDFFKDPVSPSYGSVSFPYDWARVTAKKNERGPGVYALQAALHYLGYYPPAGKNFSACPVSGVVGACTRSALEAYQRAHGLVTTGLLGPQTRAALGADLATP